MVYAIWSGAGTALVAMIGIVILGEEANVMKVASIGLVIIGVIGISLADKTS
jgi:small multidrug resistance pump